MYGEALVSSEHITGEALPVRRRPGDEIPAGAVNHDGVLVLRCTQLSADSTPTRIAKLAADARVRARLGNVWVVEWLAGLVVEA